jgi:putative zincin peptidase
MSGPDQQVAAAERVVDWRPSRTAAVLWNVLSVPLLLIGLIGFLRLATLHLPASGRVAFRALDLVLFLVLTALLTGALFVAHEGIHGLVMAVFGGRPRFGALMIAGLVPALYTTAPGHQFSRAQYLAVALTPAVTISALGALACLTAAGLVLAVPLSMHLSGCVGDFAATVRLWREPRGTRCEDLRDGIRFRRPVART